MARGRGSAAVWSPESSGVSQLCVYHHDLEGRLLVYHFHNRQLVDRRKQQELERIFEVNFLEAGGAGGGNAGDQPRKLPAFLKARKGQDGAASSSTAKSVTAAAAPTVRLMADPKPSAPAPKPSVGGGSIPDRAPPAESGREVGVAMAPAAGRAPSGGTGAPAGVVEAIPDLPVPHWSRGRNARLGSKELQVRRSFLWCGLACGFRNFPV